MTVESEIIDKLTSLTIEKILGLSILLAVIAFILHIRKGRKSPLTIASSSDTGEIQQSLLKLIVEGVDHKFRNVMNVPTLQLSEIRGDTRRLIVGMETANQKLSETILRLDAYQRESEQDRQLAIRNQDSIIRALDRLIDKLGDLGDKLTEKR